MAIDQNYLFSTTLQNFTHEYCMCASQSKNGTAVLFLRINFSNTLIFFKVLQNFGDL